MRHSCNFGIGFDVKSIQEDAKQITEENLAFETLALNISVWHLYRVRKSWLCTSFSTVDTRRAISTGWSMRQAFCTCQSFSKVALLSESSRWAI